VKVDDLDKLHEEKLTSQKHRNELGRWKVIAVSTLSGLALGFTGTSNQTFQNSELVLCLVPLICAYTDLLYYHDGLVINVLASFTRLPRKPKKLEEDLMSDYEAYTREMRRALDKQENIRDIEKIKDGISKLKEQQVLIGQEWEDLETKVRKLEDKANETQKQNKDNESVYPDNVSIYFMEKIATIYSSRLISLLIILYPFFFPPGPVCDLKSPVPPCILPEQAQRTTLALIVSGIMGLVLTFVLSNLYKKRKAAILLREGIGKVENDIATKRAKGDSTSQS
jgi:uncharacterized protein YoxC